MRENARSCVAFDLDGAQSVLEHNSKFSVRDWGKAAGKWTAYYSKTTTTLLRYRSSIQPPMLPDGAAPIRGFCVYFGFSGSGSPDSPGARSGG